MAVAADVLPRRERVFTTRAALRKPLRRDSGFGFVLGAVRNTGRPSRPSRLRFVLSPIILLSFASRVA